MESTEELKELFERIGKGTAVTAAPALVPALEQIKNQVFQELAYAKPDALVYARIAGKAAFLEELLNKLRTDAEDGKLALEELQKGGH